MRFLTSFLFIIFNIYLIESADRTESDNSQGMFESEKSEFVPGESREGRNEQEEVSYDEYELEDARQNSISGKNEKPTGNSTDSEGVEGFPNEVFLSLRNITADAATAFRSFTNRNDVVDLQASASDNLNSSVSTSYGDAESAGINLRILRDAGHPPQIIDGGEIVQFPYKHTKIDTADLSDCALQGEWKPIGVAHGHLHVGDDHSAPHQVEVLQSVGSYAVPNKVIPLWQQNTLAGANLLSQDAIQHNHKPSGLYASGTGGGSYGPGFGYGSGSGILGSAFTGSAGGLHFASNGFSGSGLGHFQKIKSASMLSPPPIPPIILGKKPGFWKLPKTKHKFPPGMVKNRRPFPGGSYGFPGHGFPAGSGFGHAGGYSGSGGGGFLISGGSGHLSHGVEEGGSGVINEIIKGGGGGAGVSGYGSGGSSLKGVDGAVLGFSTSGGHGYGSGGAGVSGYGGGGSSLKGVEVALGGFSNSGGHGFGGGGSSLKGVDVAVGGFSNSGGYGFGGGGSSLKGVDVAVGGYSTSGGHGYGSGGAVVSGYGSGGSSLKGVDGAVLGFSTSGGHEYGSGGAVVSGYGNGGSSLKGVDVAVGGFSNSGGHGFGGGNGGVLSVSEGSASLGHISHGIGGGAVAEHLVAGTGVLEDGAGSESGVDVEEEVSGGHGYVAGDQVAGGHGYVGGDQVAGGQLISASGAGSIGGDGVLVLSSGGHGGGIEGGARPEAGFLTAEVVKPSGQYVDSSFSSGHIRQGLRGANSLPDSAFLSSHINQDFANHGQGVSDDLSSSSTFTCGKNHDHNTNYHTATFQVADHDHPSSVDVLQYGGDAAVLIKAGDASFHDQILPERKHYKTSHLSDAEVSGSDNRNELTIQTGKLTSNPTEDVGQIEPAKADDGEEPERHSYYHEITKVTKIPATSVGSVQYTFSQYETKPQTFSTESEAVEEEPEVEQPQIVRELEHLSNKFQLDLENPQKLFEDPPTQELAYHYPFQDAVKAEGPKEDLPEGITEFPYQFYNPNKVPLPPGIYKKPIVKYIPRPGKPHFHQKTTVNYLQPKPPLIVVRKPKPKHILKKQNYEVREHGGERHRPLGEVFPPQKFPKQFHNPKPNFAVDRPKNGWRPDVQEYKFEHSHGKKVRKLNTKAKLLAPVLIRRPVSPAPVIRVVEVAG